MSLRDSRRSFLALATASVALTACRSEDEDEDVGAVEDLMREHGVIRRVLVVYRESAMRLRVDPVTVPPEALQRAAQLMQNFGEDYHEKALEEAHLFPAVKRAGGAAAALIDALLAQHQRGREITGYVLSTTRQAIGVADAEPLARALEAFARMYEEHAAQEDTVVFQAWKKSMSKKQLDEMGDMFEDIEHKTFGKDGFDDAIEKIAAIEASLGLTLAGMLAPAPPAVR
ncbi:MAG TPA: hemerythrin domain-containing protein [Polyangiaceae bacterium]